MMNVTVITMIIIKLKYMQFICDNFLMKAVINPNGSIKWNEN